MADGTKIEWTDATVNAINGCTVVSPGCTNCYAMRLAGTRMKTHPTRAGLTIDTKAGPVWNGEVRFNEKALLEPLSWRRPRQIFWNAHGDTFHESVPDEWIDRCFAVMALTPHHTHQVLTKRPERMRKYFRDIGGTTRRDWVFAAAAHQLNVSRMKGFDWPLPNVWLGTSVEDRTRMLERASLLKETPAAVRWWSAEPLLGDLGEIPTELMPDWIVAGGESGPGARPMHPDWARSLRDQCAAAGVPFHFKQWGEWAPSTPESARGNPRSGWKAISGAVLPKLDELYPENGAAFIEHIGKKRAGRLLDGVEHNGFPHVVQFGQCGGQIAEVFQ